MLASVAVASATTVAHGATTRWNCSLSIPNTVNGLYIDIDTRTSATTAITGWDLQLYSSTPTAGTLTAFGAIGTGFMKAPGPGGLYFGSLTSGTTINAAASYTIGGSYDATFQTGGMTTPGLWNLNSVNSFGFRWTGVDGLVRFGYGYMTIGGSSSVRTLNYLEWDSTPNTSVTVVPAPGALALAALAGVGRGRRRR